MALTSTDQYWGEQLKIKDQEIESLQQQLMISGKGGSPGQPYDDPEKGKGPFVPAPPRDKLMIAHGEGRGPQPKYHNEYNEKLKLPPWVQMAPNGELIEIPWMKEQYLQEHPELQASATSRQIRDRLKPFTKGSGYDDVGGSLRGIPDSLRIQLLRDAKA